MSRKRRIRREKWRKVVDFAQDRLIALSLEPTVKEEGGLKAVAVRNTGTALLDHSGLASVEHSSRRAVTVEECNYVRATTGDGGSFRRSPFFSGL
jgi:hypothetical protein